MNSSTTSGNWYKTNNQYFMIAIDAVYDRLKHYINLQAKKDKKSRDKDSQDKDSQDKDSKIKDSQEKKSQVEDFLEEEYTQELEAIAASMSAPPALEKLCLVLELSQFERQILLLCAGMAIYQDFPYLCAQANSNLKMHYPTLGLALDLFPNKRWEAITPESPLRYWQLLNVEPGLVITLCPLSIDECILHYLLGTTYYDPQLANLMQPPQQVQDFSSLPPSHQNLAETIAATWSVKVNSFYTAVQLCGSEVSTKKEIATHSCLIYGSLIQVISAQSLPTATEQLNYLIRKWERQASLTGSVLFLDCHDIHAEDKARELAILRLIETTYNTSYYSQL